MKAANQSRLLMLTALGLMTLPVGTVLAQTSPRNAVARAQSVAHASKGTVAPKTHKANSFAPRPTRRRVFGAPIQPPIVSQPKPPK